MIREIGNGDIFASNAAALVNPVNTQGISGAGLAKEFRQRYPDMFDQYVKTCHPSFAWKGAALDGLGQPMLITTPGTGDLTIGTVFVYTYGGGPGVNPRHIICFPTKVKYWQKSRIVYIERGLIALREKLTDLEIPSVAIPALGCGLGGLRWETVWPLVVKYLDGIDGLDVELYAPRRGD